MWLNGWPFQTALQKVAEQLGMVDATGRVAAGKPNPAIQPDKRGRQRQQQREQTDPFSLWHPIDLEPAGLAERVRIWSRSKPGVDPASVLATEVAFGSWSDGETVFDVLGFTGYRFPEGMDAGEMVPSCLHIYRADGQKFPETRRQKERKNHNVYGSRNSWIFVGGRERFQRADVVWKTEGLTDAFALLPLLPPHHAVVTMTNGCAWRAGSDGMPPLAIFRGKRVVVSGDADVPGQTGADSFAADVATVADSVFVCQLPYSIEPDHGKDLRDWCCEDDWTWSHLKELLIDWESLLDFRQTVFGEAGRVSAERTFSGMDLTDLGNAAHFAAHAKSKLRFNFVWKKWLSWDGMRWRSDDDGRPIRLAKRVVEEMWSDARVSADSDAFKFVEKSARRERLTAMIELAKDELPVTPLQLDPDSMLLNCVNGTVDLRTGQIYAHRQGDHITKLCPTAFDPNAEAPTWERFLGEVFEDHPEVVDFMRRWCGYCLTGSIEEQKLPVFWGHGSNGKSTLLNAVKSTIGTDYTMQAQSDLLIDRKHEQHPTELADLFGKRFVICSETEHGRRLAEAKLKSLTGGEPIRARRMREDFWEFLPECKLVLVTNHRPQVYGTDYGVWRRLLLVPFTATFGEDRKDPELPRRLEAESAGILAWMVRGCLEWQTVGLCPPESIVAATESYAASEDIIGRFVSENCHVGEDFRVKSKALVARFRQWCDEVGEPQLSTKRLGKWLTERGHERFRSDGYWWRGIGLQADESASVESWSENEKYSGSFFGEN